MAVVVLVHGGWHGGWVWRSVATRLRAAGHEVHTPTLTGVGERAHLHGSHVGLATHVEDVVAVLGMEDLHDVLLVGHSSSGAVITGVAQRAAERWRAWSTSTRSSRSPGSRSTTCCPRPAASSS